MDILSFKLRTVIFWAHLVVGILVGVVVLLMSATGVLLTYERQISEWVEQSYRADIESTQALYSVDKLIALAQVLHPNEDHFQLRIVNRPGAAVPVWAGPKSYLANASAGEMLREGQGTVDEVFGFVTNLHRWFAIEGKGFGLARSVINYSNLLFFFLIVSGVYLWLPRVLIWLILKTKILFNPLVNNAKARDYNWHHVFSFWALLPLSFMSLCATVFYFSWASSTLYAAYGEVASERSESPRDEPSSSIIGTVSYDSLLEKAKVHASQNGASDWYSIWLQTGTASGETEFYIDRSIGHRPNLAYEITLNIDSGDLIEAKFHEDWSRGDRAWDVARFGHTGEWWGFFGQTIAGLASLAACLLVYTGLALAWRRLTKLSPQFSLKVWES